MDNCKQLDKCEKLDKCKQLDWLFIGPTPLSGIGQVMLKYSQAANGKHLVFGEKITQKFDYILAFVLPVKEYIDMAKEYQKYAKNTFYAMTICETLTVHTSYLGIFKEFENVLTPSEFCRNVFKNQFGVDSTVVPLYQSPTPERLFPTLQSCPYTFYTIGNLADPRKNIRMLVDAFIRCNFGSSARLLLKATCAQDFHMNIPNVQVINGLISDEDLEKHVHNKAHCYINCSHSEGVGMGAVEAALRNKPVIITDFGGLKEYVKTQYTIKCTPIAIGNNAEFLFTPDMVWGQPDKGQLITFMKECFDKKLTIQEHPETILKVNQALMFFSHAECNNTYNLD